MTHISKQILKGHQEGGKTYNFSEQHDENLPTQMWFQESEEGLVVFMVFYTQACRWSRCLGCNLPSKGSQFHVSYKALIAQIDHVFANAELIGKRTEIRKVILSNNGSVLDQETFSSTALMYLTAKINLTFPNLAVLSIETRPEYVEVAELEFLRRALGEGDTPTELELAIGFEAFDGRIRNDVYRKGLQLAKFEAFVRRISPFGYRLKLYFMQKPVPGMSDEEAVLDIHQAIDYLSKVAEGHRNVRVSIHLNPTYVAFGTPLEESFKRGEYAPPMLVDVARAAIHAEGTGIYVFLGLFDEGMAAPGGSFVRAGEETLVEQLELFNRTQDFGVLHCLIPTEK